MCTMLFRNRYDNVKPFYNYLSILLLRENIKLQKGKHLAKKEPEFVLGQFPLHFIEAINNTNGENLQYPTIEHQ